MNIKSKYKRKLSSSEKLYLATEDSSVDHDTDLKVPFSIQILIEAEGNIDRIALRNAIEIASSANPGCRLILSGYLNKAHWIDSEVPPKLVEIDAYWDGINFESNPYIHRPLDERKGPTSEVLIFKSSITSNKQRLLFRSLHATMDAKGVLTWIKDVFRILRKDKAKGSCCSITDREQALTLGKTIYRPNYAVNAGSPLGRADRRDADKNEHQFSWQRKRVAGNYSSLVARIAEILTEQLTDDGTLARFMIPVDLRMHRPEHRTTANLSNPLYIEVTKGTGWKSIYQSILMKLQHNDEGIIGKWDELLHYVPSKITTNLLNTLYRYQIKRNRFMLTAVISNLGKINLAEFSCIRFTAKTMSFLPINNPLSPATLIIAEFEDHFDMTLSSPRTYATNQRQNKLLSLIESRLQNSVTEKNIENTTVTALPSVCINIDSANYDQMRTVVDFINDTIASNPDKIALNSATEQVTYRELDRKTNHIAGILQSKGIKSGDIIAICLPRSADFIICLLGVLRLGAAYLPIDQSYPKLRIQDIINDAQPALFITDMPDNKHYVAECNQASMTELLAYPSIPFRLPLDKRPSSDCLAYVIYTSGSTGKPKGVAVEHQQLLNYILWAKSSYTDQQAKNTALFTSIAFDLTVTSIFLPLICGGTMNIYPNTNNPQTIRHIVEDPENHIIKLTPSHLKLLLEQLPESLIKTVTQRYNAKTFIVGGENFPTSVAKRISELNLGKIRIFNEYGPTECTVGCMIHEYHSDKDKHASVLIGKPAENTNIYLLDEQCNPVIQGEKGEIYIAGQGVARGYLGNQLLTNKKFHQDLFNPNLRMYRSGDMARLLEDGNIAYLGRVDDQVKINGYRIELGDVETALMRHKAIKNCAVLPVEQSISGNLTRQILICFYKTETLSNCRTDVETQEHSKEALQLYLKQQLPEYMLPTKLVKIENIPLTANGKVDKEKLISTVDSLPLGKHEISKIVDSIPDPEQQLEAIWLSLFALENIDRNATFFDLGGDSLQLVFLFSQIIDEILSPKDTNQLYEKTIVLLDNLTFQSLNTVVLNIAQRPIN